MPIPRNLWPVDNTIPLLLDCGMDILLDYACDIFLFMLLVLTLQRLPMTRVHSGFANNALINFSD
ncbi:hypothetical protein AX14_000813, partial [Amanita brunnescens Koide BX004]